MSSKSPRVDADGALVIRHFKQRVEDKRKVSKVSGLIVRPRMKYNFNELELTCFVSTGGTKATPTQEIGGARSPVHTNLW